MKLDDITRLLEEHQYADATAYHDATVTTRRLEKERQELDAKLKAADARADASRYKLGQSMRGENPRKRFDWIIDGLKIAAEESMK